MYCAICGTEVRENESCCPNCGAKLGSAQASGSSGIFLVVRNNIDALGYIKLKYFAAVLFQIISIFLINSTKVYISYDSFYSVTKKFTLFEGNETLKNVFILGYIVAAVAILLPLLSEKPWKKINFLPGICMPLISLVYCIVVLIHTYGEYSDYANIVDLSAGLTSNGWIFLLVSLAGLFVTYTTSKYLYLE